MKLVVYFSVLSIFGCIIIEETLGATECEDGWVPFTGACYLFGFDQRLKYTEAQHYCMQHGANLVRIRDAHDANFLRHWLTHLLQYPWWIGLNDQDIENEYKWIDNNMSPDYTNWAPGEPSSYNSTHNADCVAVHPNIYNWRDTDCVAPFQPICQKIVSPEVKPVIG